MKKRSPELPQLGFLIYDIARLMRVAMMERMCDIGMTEAQWRAIAHLTRMEGCRQTDLAQALQVRPITLARVIDRLEASGLVARRQHEHDRRAVTLHLTAAAKPLIARLRTLGTAMQEDALAGITPGQRAELVRMLAAIRDNLSRGRPARGKSGQGGIS